MNLIDMTVTRTIAAPAEKVFDVWIDPKSPGGPWFGADRVILNPVVDGLFYLAGKHEGRTWPHYGRFIRMERPAGLLSHVILDTESWGRMVSCGRLLIVPVRL